MEANGGTNGGDIGGVGSPAAGEPNGGGGVDHGGSTAAGWGGGRSRTGDRRELGRAGKKED